MRKPVLVSLLLATAAAAAAALAPSAPPSSAAPGAGIAPAPRAGRFDALAIADPSSRLSQSPEPPDEIPEFEEGRAGWNDFSRAHGGGWRVYVDRRSGTPTMVEGRGIAWFGESGPPSVAELDSRARGFVASRAALMRVAPDELVLNAKGSGRMDPDHWTLQFTREVRGVPVEGERLVFYVTLGRVVAFGADRWGSLGRVPEAAYTADQARRFLYEYMSILAQERVQDLEPPRLVLVPGPAEDGPAGRYRGRVSEGIRFHLAWRLSFRVGEDPIPWVGKVSATTGEVIALYSEVASARVEGGIYPISNDGNCADFGCELPGFSMPYANVTIGQGDQRTGFAVSDHGQFTCYPAGAAVTTAQFSGEQVLAGPYARVEDYVSGGAYRCGALVKSGVCSATYDATLDLGTSGGTDCTVPTGESPGDTHAARTTFYRLNRAKQKGFHYLFPGNDWIVAPFHAQVNYTGACSAWYISGGPGQDYIQLGVSGPDCRNSGEISGVISHEYGHGVDYNDGGGFDRPNEGYADVIALLEDRRSCIGRGFYKTHACGGGYGDPCTTCTGVRDLDYAQHQPAVPLTPDRLSLFPSCGDSIVSGPCGKFVYCEAQIVGQAMYDLAARDLPAMGIDSASAWQLAERLFYGTRVGSGGNAYNCTFPNADSCTATTWYARMRVLDDEDGDLSNGTPHAAAIFAAFNRHGIACGAASDPTNQNSSARCIDLPAPMVTGYACDGRVVLSWSPSPYTYYHNVLRNDISCGYSSAVIGNAGAGGLYVDQGLPNDLTVYYRVQAIGSLSSCRSPVSNCLTLTTSLCCNGRIDPGEQCDLNDLGGQTCGPCTGGSVSCRADCTIDKYACTGCPWVTSSTEATPRGTKQGSYINTFFSDDQRETLTATPDSHGKYKLIHDWTFTGVPAGSSHSLHVEGFRTFVQTQDDFQFSYSTNGGGSFRTIRDAVISSPSEPPGGTDYPFGTGSLSGTVIIRVASTSSNDQYGASVSLDHLVITTQP